MIIREILDDPDKELAIFDYFNDYQDTRNFLSFPKGEHDDLIARLDAGEREWWAKKMDSMGIKSKGQDS